MPLALLSALAGWIAATITFAVATCAGAFFLIRLYAGEAALPALFKLLREGCISVSGVRLSPTPRLGPVSLRLPAALGGHVLFSADAIVASEKLWRILLLANFDVAVHGCELDAGIDEGTLVPHVGRLLLWSGLTSMQEEEGGGKEDDFEAELLRRARAKTRSGGGGGASAVGDSSDSSSSEGSGSERREDIASSFVVAEEASAVAAAAAAATAGARTAPASSSPSSPSSSSPASLTLKKQASVSFPPPVSVPFTARLRCGPATAHIGRGKLWILEAAAEVLVGKKEEEKRGGEEGKDERENAAVVTTDGVISVVFAAGAAALRREALALDLSSSSGSSSSSSSSSLRWADECSALPREPGAADGSRRRRQRRSGSAAAMMTRPLLPFALRLESRHAGVHASGWWTTTGLLLREPASAAFDLTPALVGGVLSRINPLLAGAVRLREDDAVRVSLWPLSEDNGTAAGHLPASSVRIAMKPLRLQMEPNALVAGSLRLVSGYNSAARALGGGGGMKKENAATSSSSSSLRRPAPAAAAAPSSPLSTFASFFGSLKWTSGRNRSRSSGSGGKNGPKKPKPSFRKEATLEAWTSSLSATLHGGGKNSKGFWVDSGRLDMLISKSGFAASGAKAPGTAHVAAWGTASLLPETSAAVRAREKERLARERARKKEKRKKEKERESTTGDGGGGNDGGDDDNDDFDPATSGLRMTLALMSDCLGLPGAPQPWPAVRVAVTGTALEPRIGWLGATRDAAALLLPGRRGGERGSGSGASGGGGGGGFAAQSGLLPWENHLQRSGGSRREETAGAPLGPSVVGKLERSGAKSKFAAKRGGSSNSSSSLRIRGGGSSIASSSS